MISRSWERLDINTAGVAQLALLRGLGPIRAARIVAGRPYRSTQELVTRGLISEALYDKISQQIAVARQATAATLSAHLGDGPMHTNS